MGVVSNSSNVDMVGRVGVGGDPRGRRAFLGAASHLFRCLVRAPMIVGLSIVLGIGFAAGMRERERERVRAAGGGDIIALPGDEALLS